MKRLGSIGRRSLIAGALALVLGATAIAVVVAANLGDPLRAVAITPGGATARVHRLVPSEAGLEAGALQDGDAHRFYTVSSANVQAAVDANSGQVLSLTVVSGIPTTAVVAITANQAASVATAYAHEIGVKVDGLNPSVELLDHGDTKEYAVTWTEQLNGVSTPTLRRVSVNPATGQAYAFLNFDRPYQSPPAPKLTSDDAGVAARASIGHPDAVVRESHLLITFDANGVQHLTYEVNLLTTDGFIAIVRVDASTGVATVFARG